STRKRWQSARSRAHRRRPPPPLGLSLGHRWRWRLVFRPIVGTSMALGRHPWAIDGPARRRHDQPSLLAPPKIPKDTSGMSGNTGIRPRRAGGRQEPVTYPDRRPAGPHHHLGVLSVLSRSVSVSRSVDRRIRRELSVIRKRSVQAT